MVLRALAAASDDVGGRILAEVARSGPVGLDALAGRVGLPALAVGERIGALAGSRRQIHRHLADSHGDVVQTLAGDAEGRMQYRIACPRCGGEIRHQVKPRWRDPAFLSEFEPGIRLVAFDLLLYHVEDAHPEGPEA